MLEFIGNNYLWIKAFHLISAVSWMAGLLYLPRLFVYHCEVETGSDLSEKFKVMELRLIHVIMGPARIAAVLFGGLLLINLDSSAWSEGWLYIKLVFVFILFGMHDVMNKWRKDFNADINIKTQKFFRVMNEVPTIIMVVVIFCAVIKPF